LFLGKLSGKKEKPYQAFLQVAGGSLEKGLTRFFIYYTVTNRL